MIDLFENPEGIPLEVQHVLSEFDENSNNTYKELERILNKLKPLGYTFDYGLDASPYELHKL
jgi:hypothetical protein